MPQWQYVWLYIFLVLPDIGTLRLNNAKMRRKGHSSKLQSAGRREVMYSRSESVLAHIGRQRNSSFVGVASLYHVLDEAKITQAALLTIVGVVGIGCFLTACCNIYRLHQERQEFVRQKTAQERALQPIALSIFRSSGQAVAIINAQYFWFGKELREEVSKYLAPDEYVHCFLWEANGREHVLGTFDCLGVLGVVDGSEVRAVVRSCALPSGVSLFTYRKDISGFGGACCTAKLWVHQDKIASLECGEFLDTGVPHMKYDTGVPQMKYLEGSTDSNGELHFSVNGESVQGSFLAGSCGQQNVILANLENIGTITLEEDFGEAVFNVSQTKCFDGWITFFESGEVVAKIAKVGSKDFGHLRLHACKQKCADGSSKFSFKKVADFCSWNESANSADQSDFTSASGTWNGRVGKRTLTLWNFPMLGNLEIVEEPF